MEMLLSAAEMQRQRVRERNREREREKIKACSPPTSLCVSASLLLQSDRACVCACVCVCESVWKGKTERKWWKKGGGRERGEKEREIERMLPACLFWTAAAAVLLRSSPVTAASSLPGQSGHSLLLKLLPLQVIMGVRWEERIGEE